MTYQINPSSKPKTNVLETEQFNLEVYQAFMTGYVRRINDATLKVPISGIRIGSAKYSRLAQINLQSRIITFSRFAIENVPERGRRYLVIHELSHVEEPSHNKRFWQIVGRWEPDYKQIGKQLEFAFKQNVLGTGNVLSQNKMVQTASGGWQGLITPASPGSKAATNLLEDEFGGIICGGSDQDEEEDFFM